MDYWITFWGGLLVTVLLVYAMLAVAITIGGFFDVKEMLATLDKRHQADGKSNGTTDEPR